MDLRDAVQASKRACQEDNNITGSECIPDFEIVLIAGEQLSERISRAIAGDNDIKTITEIFVQAENIVAALLKAVNDCAH
jgi:hypothetical protein